LPAPILAEPGLLGDPQRDQALAQHVLHRLAEAEIDPEGQRTDQFRQAHVRPGPHPRSPASSTPPPA